MSSILLNNWTRALSQSSPVLSQGQDIQVFQLLLLYHHRLTVHVYLSVYLRHFNHFEQSN